MSEITFAARDVMGTRPLYYTFKNSAFIYSDDIGDVLQKSNIDKKPNLESLHQLIRCKTITYYETFYKDVKRLPPPDIFLL